MKKMNILLACSLMALGPISANAASAKTAESKMVSACKKEYATEVKGKNASEIAEWVETKESGPDADTFKKSKCYTLHEDWEKAAGKTEAGEKHD